MSTDYTYLTSLIKELNETEDNDSCEKILAEIARESSATIISIQQETESYWIGVFDTDMYSDDSVTVYVTLGHCSKEEAFKRLGRHIFDEDHINERCSVNNDGIPQVNEYGFGVIAVDKEEHRKYDTLIRYFDAYRQLKYSPAEDLAHNLMQNYIRPLKVELGLTSRYVGFERGQY